MATLRDLLDSGMSRDEINALLSQSYVGTEGFQQNGFMGGESYMPPPERPQVEQAPINMIRNNTTGREFSPTDPYGQPSQSQPAGLAADWARPVDVMGAAGHWAKDNSGRIILRDGRIVEPGRDTGAERARMKEDLGIEKLRADVEQSRRPYRSPEEIADAREAAKTKGEKDRAEQAAKTPGTPENTRILKDKAKADSIAGAREQAKASIQSKLDNLLGPVNESGKRVGGAFDQATKNIGFFSTGLTGQALGGFGGTDAYDLETSLEPIRSNLTIEVINEMKKQSPTGATGLGQIAIKELEMLQGAVRSLKKEQSQKQLRENMGFVKKHLENWESAVNQAKAQGIPIQGDIEDGDMIPATPPMSYPAAGAKKPNLTTVDGEAMAWAMKNPNDPRAAAIKARLGVR